jgi:hypothetical protein
VWPSFKKKMCGLGAWRTDGNNEGSLAEPNLAFICLDDHVRVNTEFSIFATPLGFINR